MYYNKMGEEIIYNGFHFSNNFFHVPLAGITYPNNNYRILHNYSTHNTYWDSYVFEYVIKGKGFIEEKQKRYTVKEGDFYFLNKLKQHHYYSDKNMPYKKIFFVIKGKIIDGLLNAFNITESVIIKPLPLYEDFLNIHQLLINTTGENINKSYNKLIVKLVELLQKIKDINYISEYNKKEALPSLIKNYIDNNINNDITLKDIQNLFNISIPHILRIFKKAYNTTPIKYTINKKLELCAHLLLTTNFSITEIADILSFSDPKYLSKQFRAAYKASPIAYRKGNI